MLARVKSFVFPFNTWAANESRISIFFGRLFAVIAVILVGNWCMRSNTDDRFLGGIHFSNRNKIFNFHPFCMVTSMLLCMGLSMTSFRDGWSFKVSKYLHLNFNLLAKIFMIVGLRAVYVDHDEPEGKHSSYHYRHFGSMHSWMGLTTSILLFQQDFLGGIHYLYPNFFGVPRHYIKFYRDYHIFFGKCAFAAAGCTMLTGIAVKNEFISCGRTVDTIDRNPFDGYNLIPPGCQVSQGLGLCIVLSVFFILFGLRTPMKPFSLARPSILSGELPSHHDAKSLSIDRKDSEL